MHIFATQLVDWLGWRSYSKEADNINIICFLLQFHILITALKKSIVSILSLAWCTWWLIGVPENVTPSHTWCVQL